MLRTSQRWWIAVVAGFATIVTASAEPIHWSYRAVDPNGVVLRETTELTESDWSDFFIPNPQTHGVELPDSNPDNALKTKRWVSEALVTITDELSGESGDVEIFREWIRQFEEKWDGSLEPIYEGENGEPWPDAYELQLGTTLFSVRAPGGELMVSVVPGLVSPPNPVPEPATITLAVLGGVAFAVRRRRN